MKSGFYLSPCGKHITEVQNRCNKHVDGFIIYLMGHSIYFNGTPEFAMKILLSGWELLK